MVTRDVAPYGITEINPTSPSVFEQFFSYVLSLDVKIISLRANFVGFSSGAGSVRMLQL